jgi:hypothetical protein
MKLPKPQLFVAAALLAGCAAQRARQEAPAPPAEAAAPSGETESGLDGAEPRTLEEAEAALERARAELSALTIAESPPASGGAPQPTAPAPAPAEAAQKKDERTAEEGAAAGLRPPDPCATACRAFGSLLRARDAVCRLEAPRGERCARAEDIVRDAEGRVRSCTCSP